MKLSNFKVDSNAIENGAWVSPGEEYDDLQIKTRGFTDQYTDGRAAKMRRAALQAGFGTATDRLSQTTSREILVECLISYCLLDVRKLLDDNGVPVTFDAFCELLRNPSYPDLFTAALKAVGIAGVAKATSIETAAGN